jgi:hypothetical protein
MDHDLLPAPQAVLDRRAVAETLLPADRLVRGAAVLREVRGVDVRDVQETVLDQAEINEGRLDGRLDVGDAALVNVADVAGAGDPLHVEFFELGVGHYGDSAFLPLDRVNEHFFNHLSSPIC